MPDDDDLEAAIGRVAAVAAMHADAVDRDGRFPQEAVAALRQERLLGAMLPEALGGSAASLHDLARVAQRLGETCASTGMIFAMHQIQVACVVLYGLSQPWYVEFARRIASDQLLLASITSEVDVGGDMRSSLCSVVTTGDRFTLTKHATTISYGAQADAFLVTARAHPDAPRSDQVLVGIEKTDCTLTATGGWDTLGMRGTVSRGFTFGSAGVADQVLSTPFADIAAETMTPVSHLLWAAVWMGIAAEAVSRARKFLRVQARRQPGTMPPGAPRLMQAAGLLESMQQRLRILLHSYDASHPLGSTRTAASEDEAGWPTGMARATTMNMLKHDVSEMCYTTVMQSMLICGISGYKNDSEFSIGRHLRDVLSAQLMVSNDRIALNTGAMLIAQRSNLGRV